MGSFGGFEWLIIILIIIIFFGAKKIPDVARGLGQGIAEFRKAKKDDNKKTLSDDENSSSDDANRDPKNE